VTLLTAYAQFGLVLMKRAFVRERSVAAAEDAETYLRWRESLRRLSTTVCDYIRLSLMWAPIVLLLASQIDHLNGNAVEVLNVAFCFLFMPVILWFEWRKRQDHLRIARESKPVDLLIRPDTTDLAGIICFRPSFPILLMRGPQGYALNLASAPIRTAVLYFTGSALLLAILIR